jgi:hypothetical protein
VEFRNVLYVPDLQMPLLSVRTHRRRGAGCSFIADPEGCWLTIDDGDDCLLPFSYAPDDSTAEYSQPRTLSSASRAYLASTVSARRMTVAQQ